LSTEKPTVDVLIEVYRCTSPLEADRAILEVLEPAGIAAFRRDRTMHALPAPDAEAGGYFIAVPSEDAAHARQLLAEAQEDEALDADDGDVLA
jgi:hypothetical protein